MKGCRPITKEEQKKILAALNIRDRTLFILGMTTGFRISELLSIKIQDVYENGKIVEKVYVRRAYVKKKTAGRCVKLNKQAQKAIEELIEYYKKKKTFKLDWPLFQSQKDRSKPVTRQQISNIFYKLKKELHLTGKLNTHSLRKTFADRMYKVLDKDLFKLQRALAHESINSTVKYLSFKEEEIDEAIEKIFEV